MSGPRQVPMDDLLAAQKTAAILVKLYGESYLPHFRRLEQEVLARKQANDDISRALAIANEA